MDSKTYPTIKNPSFSGLIGVSQEDITPPVGIYARNWGAARHEIAEGIHRPLMLTCHTFQSSENEQPLVLIGADLGWWKSAEDEHFLRHSILKALSLEPSNLMFCLSHTHAGPSLFTEDAEKPGGNLIRPYLEQVIERAVAAIKNALSTAVPATLAWHYGTCDLATNRDLPERTSDRLLVAFNPDEVADDTLLVGRITDSEDRIMGTIVNYACHPTTLAWDNRLISPDYIGAMREVIESETKAPCLFLQGASGELAPKEQYVGDLKLADSYGRQLGFAVLSVLEGMFPAKSQLYFSGAVESGAPLGIWKKKAFDPSKKLSAQMIAVEFPLKPLPSLAEIEKEWADCQDNVLKERLWRKRGIRKTVGEGETSKMPLWIWQLGDSFLIGQPNEAYAEFQQKLREQLAPNAVAAINIVNGYAGYLPPKDLYPKDMYAVWQTPFASGSLELLIATAVEAAQRMI
ncbi:neutral/alkaline non-lysosomal ceramidase N-terminal domain-containing protein [Dyadobacter diqingensis]|uniref:neutral/alkaline non-lysosomal ceramidase N-terminal domain-containing protein n=1 Tax=Dyadobacter diqingensis TaxID=2938121 RepID=UPI0020C25743|nr:neutral/alkaline non-lysosomal ceramidase N-terminal domain-containing protein [Dyadobacter diqingensis]